MTTAIDNLTAAVQQNSSVEASAVTLINGLAAEIKTAAASGDMTAVQGLADQITASGSALAVAVAANTPSTAAPAAAQSASAAPAAS